MKQKNEVFSQKQELRQVWLIDIVLARGGTIFFIVVMVGALVNHLILFRKMSKEIAKHQLYKGKRLVVLFLWLPHL